jgi:probable HAF family extracellular repeat protein
MKKMLKKGFVAAACAATMLAGFGSAHAADYDYIDLYEPAALVSDYTYETRLNPQPNRAMGINDDGTVVGYLKGKFPSSVSVQTRVLTWDLNAGGAATHLGLMGSNNNAAYAYGISENGQIAGAIRYRVGSQMWKSFTYDTTTGTQTNLASEITYPTHVALDINDSGQSVGWMSSLVTTYEERATTAFITNADGTISPITGASVGIYENRVYLNNSLANAINNAGLVTGYTTVDGNYQAFLYNSSTEDFTTLGTLGGGLTSVGTDVNELGVVVGYATRADGVERAFLAFGGTMVDLGALGGEGTSQAYGMNDKGDIVGTSNGHAFIYTNGQMVDLNDYIDPSLGMTLVSAYGINNMGQIVGYGTGVDYIADNGTVYYYERAFALTPSVTPTPVPASVLLFGSGIAGLCLFRRKVQA